jgi:hypothetical protein
MCLREQSPHQGSDPSTDPPEAGLQLPEHLCAGAAKRLLKRKKKKEKGKGAARKSAPYLAAATRKWIPGLAPQLPRGSVGGHCVKGGEGEAHVAPISPTSQGTWGASVTQ